jgi:quercetin dioxygenase-like cupin family protein
MPNTNRSHNPAASPTAFPPEPTPLLIRQSDLPGSPGARRLIGAEHGGLPLSLFLVDNRPGEGPRLHRHPYPELFIVHGGQAEFEIYDTRLAATAGDLVIAPAQTPHGFTNTGDEQLCVTAIHTAPNMYTEWLEPAARPNGTTC